MRKIQLAVTAGITALVVATAPLATAQSSFSSFGSSAPAPENLTPTPGEDEIPAPAPGSLEARVKNILRLSAERVGMVETPEATEIAELYAALAASGEVAFDQDRATIPMPGSYTEIVRMPRAELTEEFFEESKELLEQPDNGEALADFYGLAVTGDQENVYAAITLVL